MSALVESVRGGQPDIRVFEQYLYREAMLLDEQRWDEWRALWLEDGEYWVPATPGQPDPLNHLSLVYERGLLRLVRIKRFNNPNAFSLQPAPRSLHVVGNVVLEDVDATTGTVTVKSKFIMLQYRRDQQDVFGGVYTHRLVPHDTSYRMALKKVELVNCDSVLDNILVYL
jgi:benzoate/toluate 1,2-dioxygenase beta subunit